VSDRAFAIDLAAVASVGVAICAASDAFAFMPLLVPMIVLLRLAGWAWLPANERGVSMKAELLIFCLCVVIGAANDWQSVVRRRIYDYAVLRSSAAPYSIPAWMLLYWGLILRFVTTLCRWHRLGAPPRPTDEVHLGAHVRSSPWLKVALEVLLVLATRQFIYRHYLDAIFSWLPFAVALFVYVALFRLSRHERILAALAVTAGPAVEIALIQAGHLHYYHLGWLGGVPLWIVLWWMLAVLVWNDVSARVLAVLASSRLGTAPASALAR
jgi:hypothetical protein